VKNILIPLIIISFLSGCIGVSFATQAMFGADLQLMGTQPTSEYKADPKRLAELYNLNAKVDKTADQASQLYTEYMAIQEPTQRQTDYYREQRAQMAEEYQARVKAYNECAKEFIEDFQIPAFPDDLQFQRPLGK